MQLVLEPGGEEGATNYQIEGGFQSAGSPPSLPSLPPTTFVRLRAPGMWKQNLAASGFPSFSPCLLSLFVTWAVIKEGKSVKINLWSDSKGTNRDWQGEGGGRNWEEGCALPAS